MVDGRAPGATVGLAGGLPVQAGEPGRDGTRAQHCSGLMSIRWRSVSPGRTERVSVLLSGEIRLACAALCVHDGARPGCVVTMASSSCVAPEDKARHWRGSTVSGSGKRPPRLTGTRLSGLQRGPAGRICSPGPVPSQLGCVLPDHPGNLAWHAGAAPVPSALHLASPGGWAL